jgi:hypothetical protein
MENLNSLAQLGGTVATVVIFLYYLAKKDEGFNKIIDNHLIHSNKVIKDNSKALNKVSVNLKELSLTIKNNGKKNKD